MMNRQETIQYLEKVKLNKGKIAHSIQVADVGINIAQAYQKAGYSVDIDLVEFSCLVHDIGIAKTIDDESPVHLVYGAEMAKAAGFGDSVVEAIEGHECCGLLGEEALLLGLPEPVKESYIPQSLEAKIVAFADMLVFLLLEFNCDPWKDINIVKTALYAHYLSNVWRKLHNEELGNSNENMNALMNRYLKVCAQMLPYADKEFILSCQ